jgi:TRAP-type C4-dicarboxylate transport system substrate-binding protein
MIEGFPTTPLLALTLQWYRHTPHMAGIGMAPLVGGLVMTKQAWNKIPPADQAKLQAACLKLEKKLETGVPRQDTTAVEEMKKRGLVVDAVPAGAVAEWRVAAEQFAKGMRGTLIPPDILDLATRERDAFRFRAAKGNP